MSWHFNLRSEPGESGWRRHIAQALLLVVIPSFAAIGFNFVRSDGLPFVALHDYTDDILVPCPENLIEAEPVHVDSLPMGSGDIVIVDARSAGEYLTWHIIGALSIPHRSFQSDAATYEQEIASDLVQLDALRDFPIVVCGDARVGSGRALGAVLRERGFEDVRYLVGGCASWAESGRPIESADHGVTSLEIDDIDPELDGFIVVDARFSRYFRRGHLPGATCVSYAMVSGPDDPRLDPLREHTAARILIYGSASRGEGESLARLLESGDWLDVSFLAGGFEAWQEAGYPIETDSPPEQPTESEPNNQPNNQPVSGSEDGSGSGSGVPAEMGRPQ